LQKHGQSGQALRMKYRRVLQLRKSILFVAMTSGLAGSVAGAQGLPLSQDPAYPLPAETPVVPQSSPSQSDKAGAWFFNIKLGTRQGIYNSSSGTLEVVLDFGRSLTASGNLYFVLPLQFAFLQNYIATDESRITGSSASISVPIGLQYDVPLLIPGMYLTPRVVIGYSYAASQISGLTTSGSVGVLLSGHRAILIPEFGWKWVFRRRMNFGADLLSIPITLSDTVSTVSYRVLFYLGVTF
jgi:hypothetical protein